MKFDTKMALLRLCILCLSILSFTFSCEEQKEALLGCWTQLEEGEDTYKPCDFKTWPASRFRQVYDFRDNGMVSYLVLHPADAHYISEAKWEFSNSGSEVHIKESETGDLIRKLNVSFIDEETIILEILP